MLETLTARLARIVKQVRGEARLTEANIQEALREVRIALLEADVALPVAKHFIESVRAKALGAKRAIPLPVSAPFHCALMQPAADRLAPAQRAASRPSHLRRGWR